MKRLLVTLAALLLAATTMASCTRAEARVDGVSCDGNITEQTAKTEAELRDARKDAKDAEGTPAESEANDRADELEVTLEALRACTQEGTTPSSTPANCPSSWARVDSDKTGHRWFANGIPSIAEAVTPEQAQAAVHDWFSAAKQDPVTLSGAVRYLIDRDVNQAELFDSNGCATQVAVDLAVEAETALALSLFAAEKAPSNGYNSGANGNGVVSSSKAGIRGDRRAVKIVTPKGVTIWVMYRCGNPVTMRSHPKVPKGPTDENPSTTRPVPPTTRPVPPTTRPVPPTTWPVTPTTWLVPKDPSKNIDRNPEAPPQVRKDRPSPDNQKRVENGPTKPVDTPSGCSGPCPTAAPPTTRPVPPTTRPVSIGGNTGITPPPTVAPPVAPPVTSSPTVPVVSP